MRGLTTNGWQAVVTNRLFLKDYSAPGDTISVLEFALMKLNDSGWMTHLVPETEPIAFIPTGFNCWFAWDCDHTTELALTDD